MSQKAESLQQNNCDAESTVFGAFTGHCVRVLLVEDDHRLRELMVTRIQCSCLASFTVSAATSLEECLGALKEGGHNVILLDLNLSDSQGLDTLISIRSQYPDIPVVVLTGLDSPEYARKALEQGAQDFLVKGRDDTSIDRSLFYAQERHRTQHQLLDSQKTLRSAQMKLIQADKMESIGRMAAGVAHEVKNPLAIMRMGLDYLVKNVDLADASDGAMILQDMDDAVLRAQRIINGMLDFSVPSELEVEPADITEVINQSVHMVAHELKKRGIELCLQIDGLPAEMSIDRRKIQQVMVNLLMNAIHSIDKAGMITVDANAVVLDQVGNGVGSRATDTFRLGETLVTISITDSGKGIPKESLGKLFDPFFTSKPVGQGTGLGLPITKNIIELHGGRIELDNCEQGGAVASIMMVV